MNTTAIIIPARLASTRLPEKPLADIGGKPMIQWVYDACTKVNSASAVIIATDDQKIYDIVLAFGGKVVMTDQAHTSGTDRIAEVAKNHPYDYYVNVQGDEPFISAQMIDDFIQKLVALSKGKILTAFHPIEQDEEISNPNNVKLVRSKTGKILYFSRSFIPFPRKGDVGMTYYKHIGIYGYSRDALLELTALPPSSLEKTESLEQLRWLEHDYEIYGMEVQEAPMGVDTLDDLEEARMLAKKLS